MAQRVYRESQIAAPVEQCFDVARSVTLYHPAQTSKRDEPGVGKQSGLLDVGDAIAWESEYPVVGQRFVTRITAMESPRTFTEEQVVGPFRAFRQVHTLFPIPDGTLMTDECVFSVPFRWFGTLLERVLMRRYVDALLEQRARRMQELVQQSDSIDR